MQTTPNNRSANAHFKWSKWGRTLLITFVDTIICFATFALAWLFGRFFLLEWGVIDRNLFTASDWVHLIDVIAWPAIVLLVLFLYRNPLLRILNELPSFVQRSRCDNSCRSGNTSDGQGKPSLEEISHSEAEGNPHDLRNEESPSHKRCNRVHSSSVQKDIIADIRSEIWPVAIREQRSIGNANVRFDAAYEKEGYTYAVEIKTNVTTSGLSMMLNSLDCIFSDLSATVKEKFVFVLCIVTSANAECNKIEEYMHLLQCRPFAWELRIYDMDGKKIDSRRGSPI